MNRVVLGLRYDGRNFEGWQTQPHGRTVQDTLTKALNRIVHSTVVLHCAGRTDTGVHARQQVVHLDTDVERPRSAWVKGVNNFLPAAVGVTGMMLVDDRFHARFSAVSRTYRYYFYSSPVCDPFKSFMTWVHYPLDLQAMEEAAQSLVGTHDFSAFRAAQCQAKSPVRTIHRIALVREQDHAYFEIHGNAFLHHMVRNMVGCLLEVGQARQPAQWVAQVLASRDRSMAAKTSPAQGLTLWHIEYPEHYNIERLFEPLPWK
ncbi:MAG TPA: tRNA pseudouridine(38-40) synthase TruA [Limnobacter sp.]|nr:tRNA pseudouridine(38-40) synthase TruA [Limnobacter sp.]